MSSSNKNVAVPTSIARQIQLEDKMQPAVSEFNNNPSDGVPLLCNVFSLPLLPKNIAHILHIVPGLNGTRIGEYLSKKKNEEILYFFFREVDMHFSFVEGLRSAFSTPLHLPAEGEQIDRILQAISVIYVEQNPDCGMTSDQVYILAYATTLLNSDLHNPGVLHKMSLASFIENIRYSSELDPIPDSFLKSIYTEIKEHPYVFKRSIEETTDLKTPKLKGFLHKKNDTWKSIYKRFFFILANDALYIFKDDTPKSLSKPISAIQLTSVKILPEKDREIVILGRDNQTINYTKFTAAGPTPSQEKNRIFLKAISVENRDKWLYRLQTTSMSTEFISSPPPLCSSFSSGSFGTDISEVQGPTSDSSPLPP